jgi:hypothetical protein
VDWSSLYDDDLQNLHFSLSTSPFPVAPTLEHSASVKRFVSLQFLNLRQSVELLGSGISLSQGRYRINRHPCLE